MRTSSEAAHAISTKVPARLDRLPWPRWHWMIVIGLGTVWILDGLEVTIVGNISGQMSMPGSGIHITQSQITGFGAATYVAGACVGALFFGWLTDRFGRKKLFMITLGTYLAATALTALSFAPWWFFLFRFLTGFGVGVVLGLVILLVRRNVPESPRWLFIHGQAGEAEHLVDGIEDKIERDSGQRLAGPRESITIRQRKTIGFLTIGRTMVRKYPRRTVLGFSLFIGQAFLYNAITFGYAQILAEFFHVKTNPGYYFAVIAVGNLIGPLVLARFFDVIGRRPMISGTYLISGVLLLVTAYLFDAGLLTATTMTACWCVVLFFASAGASSAYLTVSEVFPMETRALRQSLESIAQPLTAEDAGAGQAAEHGRLRTA